uniref:Uncharacterized protein n=1 Tax=Anguilla anguilla TaxID=7936 RepID=A0A0E9SJR9_ANGAN
MSPVRSMFTSSGSMTLKPSLINLQYSDTHTHTKLLVAVAPTPKSTC